VTGFGNISGYNELFGYEGGGIDEFFRSFDFNSEALLDDVSNMPSSFAALVSVRISRLQVLLDTVSHKESFNKVLPGEISISIDGFLDTLLDALTLGVSLWR
jgi:hypothetical protein